MKHLKKVLPLIILVSLGLTACSGDEPKLPSPDARISVAVGSGATTPPQVITVDASTYGYFRLRISIDNTERATSTLVSLAIDALNGAPVDGGLLTAETIRVDSYGDLNAKLSPGSYTLLLDGALTQVKIIVNPNGTIPSPATTADPA